MRSENQQWDQLRVLLEVVIAGVGQTGLTPTVTIKRLFDGQWLQANGSWNSSPASLSMVAVDAANLPGLYNYAPSLESLDYATAKSGFYCKISETTHSILEYLKINVDNAEWEEDPADHQSADTMGRVLQIVRGLVQGEHRLKNPTYDTEGRMLTAQVAVYPSSSDALADTNALATYNVTCTYSSFGDLTSLVSRS